MGEAVAIDRSHLLESPLKSAHSLNDKRASNSKTAEEERNLHALSAVVASQVEAPHKDVTKDEPTFVADTKRADSLEAPRRYKNPLLAIFAVMSVARRTMKDVAKSSKEQTRLLKKHWEQLSHDVSGHYDKSAKSSESVNNWSGVLTGIITLAPTVLIPIFPKDKGDYTTLLEKLNDGYIHSLFGMVSSQKPSEWVQGFAEDHKGMAKLINEGQKTAQNALGPMTQQWGQTVSMENQRDVAVGQQRSQASQTEYQSRKEEKSAEDQAVSNIEQTLQRLMEQEARTFEVRG